jgi:methylmalonyl-CoA mutase cobalamin-binding subunit
MMPKSQPTANSESLAKRDDIKRIIGQLDDAKLLDIMALGPTIADVEEASMWLSGDADIFGAGNPLKRVPGDIVAIVTADEDEEPSRPH